MSLRPSVEEERWLALAARLPAMGDAHPIAGRGGPWKGLGLMKRSAFFVFGVVCAGLTFGILELLHLPGYPWICALLLLGAAEWLIVGRRLFGCGIEEALEIAALLIIAIVAVDFRPGGHEAARWLLVAAAMGFAGLRLLNPVYSTISVVVLSAAVHDFVAPQPQHDAWGALLAGGFCFAVGATALACCMLDIRRPSYDRMVGWLTAAMPVCGYLWLSFGRVEASNPRTILLFPLAFGAAALAVGTLRRLHAPLVAFMLCAACVAYELRRYSGLSLQERLMLGGGAILVIAIVFERYLREPRRGITSRELAPDGSLDLQQLAGYAALAPQSHTGPDSFKGGGGTSSGGGASGTF